MVATRISMHGSEEDQMADDDKVEEAARLENVAIEAMQELVVDFDYERDTLMSLVNDAWRVAHGEEV
jgi:hypothetical protein